MRDRPKIRDERGFTLAEMLATLAILGILVAIAAIVLLGILEQRRVDAAALQLASDLRLANTRATNQLTDWRVIVVLDLADENDGPDYYIARLDRPYVGDATPTFAGEVEPRFFPDGIRAKNVVSNSGGVTDDFDGDYWISPWDGEPPPGAQTKTFEFNSNGTAKVYGGASGSVCVTQDNDPQNRIATLAATSRTFIEYSSSCNTETGDN